MTAAESATVVDARPMRPVAVDTSWDRAVATRDRLAAQLRDALATERLEALVFASANGNYPPWVKLEAWLPAPERASNATDGRERAELLIVVDVKPYHLHQLVISVQATRGGKTISVAQRAVFSNTDVVEWTRYTLHRAGKPSSYRPLLDALLPSWIARWKHNPLDRAYRTRWLSTATGLLGLGALALLLVAAAAAAADAAPVAIFAAIAAVGCLIGAGVIARRRLHTVFVPEQSAIAPRNLGLVDSWHAVIAELGRDYDAIKARLVNSIAVEDAAGLSCLTEAYGYRTPNGYEERERLVVAKGQGVAQVHIYRFSDDLFVGWDAYLNWAQWNETASVSSKLDGRQAVEFRELRQGYYVPNQFDLIDLNALSELVHRRIERELKTILKEKEIDQEIDFSIIRGDRDAALNQQRHGDQTSSRRSWRYVANQQS
jgi:hypothetical protein